MPEDKPSLTFTCISSPGMSVIWPTLEVESVMLSPTAETGRSHHTTKKSSPGRTFLCSWLEDLVY
jgi:hypothetical protein